MIIDELKLLTNNLIKFKTVRPDNKDSETTKIFKDEINKCMGFVCKSLHKSIITDRADEYIYDESCPILIAKFHDWEPDLLMVGHIDVVNGDESQFHPYEKDGKIYGRGAKDMKSGVAAMIEIMNHYAEKREKPNIAMAVVSDEESGGFNGSNIIVNKIGIRPEFVVTPDPGERHGIINKEKGFIWLTITIFGKSSHASRPWLGDCAYTKAFRLCQDILSKFNLSQSEDDWRTTASVTQIKKLVERSNCQDKFILDTSNAIAGVVKCSIDIRYTENDKIEEIKDGFKVNKSIFYSKFHAEIDILIGEYKGKSELVIKELEKLRRQVEARKKDIINEKQFEDVEDHTEQLKEIYDKYEKIRQESNNYTNNLQKEQAAAKEKLRLKEAYDFIKTIDYDSKIEEINALKQEKERASDEYEKIISENDE